MVGAQQEDGAPDRDAMGPQQRAKHDEDVVDEALAARPVHQPVEDRGALERPSTLLGYAVA